jgi:hypothetical protein
MKKRGRPTKLNDELTNRIVEFIQQGCNQKTACNLAGVPYSCFNEWKQKGNEGNEPYATFFSVISRARDEHKHLLINLVMAGARGLLPRPADWKAASWLLSKGWPLEFGDRIAVETDPVPVSSMPPMNLILSMPDGTQRPTSFTEAEKILCAGFTRRDEIPEESEPGNSDGINIGPRFNP